MTELPPEWLYFHNAELIVGTLALIVNFTLMYFIICKTPKELKEYRPYVFVITFADTLFTIVVIFVIRPIFILPIAGAIIMGPVKALGYSIAFGFSFFGTGLWAFCTFSINLAFIYRYVTIGYPPHSWHAVFAKKDNIAMLIAFVCLLCVGLQILPMADQDKQTEILSRVEDIIPSVRGHADDFVIVSAKITIGLFVNTFVSMGFSYALNATLAYRIVKKLRSYRASFSLATYQMHHRLVVCLLCQTFFPFVLLGVPAIISAALAFYGAPPNTVRIATSSLVFVVSFHPLLNALCALIFIRPYRILLIKDRWLEQMIPSCFKDTSNDVSIVLP